MKRGYQGLGRCHLCGSAFEDCVHLFLECPFDNAIWEEVSDMLKGTGPVSFRASCTGSLGREPIERSLYKFYGEFDVPEMPLFFKISL